MKMRRWAAAAAALALATAVVAQGLPNLVAVRTIGSDGVFLLKGWHPDKGPVPDGTILSIRPDDPMFFGARVWQIDLPTEDPVGAARASVKAMGLDAAEIKGQAEVDPETAAGLGDDTRLVALIFAGRIDDAPARAAVFVWTGRTPPEAQGPLTSGVHGFAAPEQIFAALGGVAVPAVLFIGATAEPGTDMSQEGLADPQAAAERLALFVAVWSGVAASGTNSAQVPLLVPNGLTVATGCITAFGCVGGGIAPLLLPGN